MILTNATNYLSIDTYDGSDQLVHATVIDFLNEYNIEQWAGYRYWMSFTPLPGGTGDHEDPSIVVSNDGETWIIPPGLTNPVDLQNPQSATVYNNDANMVYDPDEDCLRVYFMFANQDDNPKWEQLRLRRVYPNHESGGVSSVGDREILIDYIPWTDMLISPTIWREDETHWHMWFIHNGINGGMRLSYMFSSDGLDWPDPADATLCTDNIRNNSNLPNFWAWHLNCKYNRWENRIEFLIFGYNYTSGGPYGGGTRIDMGGAILAQCSYDDLLTIDVPVNDYLLRMSSPSSKWDGNYLYRGSFIIERQEDSYFYRVWYAGSNNLGVWRLGYTEGEVNTEFTEDNIKIGDIGFKAVSHITEAEELRIGNIGLRLGETTNDEAGAIRIHTSQGTKSIKQL